MKNHIRDEKRILAGRNFLIETTEIFACMCSVKFQVERFIISRDVQARTWLEKVVSRKIALKFQVYSCLFCFFSKGISTPSTPFEFQNVQVLRRYFKVAPTSAMNNFEETEKWSFRSILKILRTVPTIFIYCYKFIPIIYILYKRMINVKQSCQPNSNESL